MSCGEWLEHLNLHSLRGRRICGVLIETYIYKLFNGLVDHIQWDVQPHTSLQPHTVTVQ